MKLRYENWFYLFDGSYCLHFHHKTQTFPKQKFNIYKGPEGSAWDEKKLAVGVTSVSSGCGRVVTLSAYADTSNRNDVGKVFEYSIVAVETYKDMDFKIEYRDLATRIFTTKYRIPYLIGIQGNPSFILTGFLFGERRWS